MSRSRHRSGRRHTHRLPRPRTCPDEPDITFMVLTAGPGSPEDHALRILSSWHTTPAPTPTADTPRTTHRTALAALVALCEPHRPREIFTDG
jgi:hypothetical protein